MGDVIQTRHIPVVPLRRVNTAAVWRPYRVLLAFDPGPHTGIAKMLDGVFRGDDGQMCRGAFQSATTLQPEIPLGARYLTLKHTVESALGRHPSTAIPPVVVIEGYHTVVALGKDGLETIKLIGWIEGVALLAGCEVHVQQPSVKKPFLDRAREYASQDDHSRDAVAHALAYMSAHDFSVERNEL